MSSTRAPDPKGPKPPGSPLGAAMSLGMELAVSMVLGVLAGRWADARLGTAPVMLLVGVAVGFGAGLYLLVRGAKQAPPDRG